MTSTRLFIIVIDSVIMKIKYALYLKLNIILNMQGRAGLKDTRVIRPTSLSQKQVRYHILTILF